MEFHGLSLQSLHGGLDHVLDEHTAIFEAVRRRDAAAGRVAMAGHVTGSRDWLFEGGCSICRGARVSTCRDSLIIGRFRPFGIALAGC